MRTVKCGSCPSRAGLRTARRGAHCGCREVRREGWGDGKGEREGEGEEGRRRV